MIREVSIYGTRLRFTTFTVSVARDSNAELDEETRICAGMLKCDRVSKTL